MDKELRRFYVILDHNHVLVLLNIKKDFCGIVKVAPAVKIIFMTVTQLPTNMRFSCDNEISALATSSKLMGSHSKIVGSSWSSEKSELTYQPHLECITSAFNSFVTSCLPTIFKNNCSASGNNLNVGWSNFWWR